jgi:hypothetical protein
MICEHVKRLWAWVLAWLGLRGSATGGGSGKVS